MKKKIIIYEGVTMRIHVAAESRNLPRNVPTLFRAPSVKSIHMTNALIM